MAGHRGGTIALAFSGDGKWFATGGRSGEAKTWDLDTGVERATFHHAGEKTTLDLSPDGRWVASTHEPQEFTELNRTGKFLGGSKISQVPIKVWDATTGKERWSLLGHPNSAYRFAYSSDGRLLASAGYQSVILWDLATGTRLRDFDSREIISGQDFLVFSPDNQLLIMAGGSQAQLSHVGTGKRLALFQGHQSSKISGLAISPDQKRLATAAGREVKIWDLLSGQEALTLPLPATGADKNRPPSVVALGWTEDGQRLRAALSDASVVEWDGTPESI